MKEYRGNAVSNKHRFVLDAHKFVGVFSQNVHVIIGVVPFHSRGRDGQVYQLSAGKRDPGMNAQGVVCASIFQNVRNKGFVKFEHTFRRAVINPTESENCGTSEPISHNRRKAMGHGDALRIYVGHFEITELLTHDTGEFLHVLGCQVAASGMHLAFGRFKPEALRSLNGGGPFGGVSGNSHSFSRKKSERSRAGRKKIHLNYPE
jgi:hypothetical protein